ncbi:AmpG family muropeptide MFS transporter [Alkalilimnicola ehrlichii]|uniref:AmpG family muropeptide MFS transporter n=1 Tax=Alkalilimnicola ehrlichii TaxID=351052 RepID=A0A3E0WWK5_9GAMM|nr:MFS transporter [Alkalilimnicola ehrlichii]RFA30035.1 AmpG family muropeptide MFS transporter [Alkalilimnicola ehrlichii]RFA37380.1 AmpG family muropeptide MFS transporter [Alkalilimnicola ehrlichii]
MIKDTPSHSWYTALTVYLRAPVLTMLFLGFSAGLPFLLVFSTLTAWLRTEDISRTAIGFFSWIGITYSIKFLWAPVIDKLRLPALTPMLGQRRSWIVAGQLLIAGGLAGMAMANPNDHLGWIVLLALVVAFGSATQDVAIDAFRIESAPEDMQAAAAASYVAGYRIAILTSGAGALFIADQVSWTVAYFTMAVLMSIGLFTVLVRPEPTRQINRLSIAVEQEQVQRFLNRYPSLNKRLQRIGAWLIAAVYCPLLDFFTRYGLTALVLLLLIGLYRISDIGMAAMAQPLYIDLGFSLTQIGVVTSIYGLAMTLVGGALGGVLVIRFGIGRMLVIGAIATAATNLLFALLAVVVPAMLDPAFAMAALTSPVLTLPEVTAPALTARELVLPGDPPPFVITPQVAMLMLTISGDNLANGFASAVFIAFLSRLTSQAYTATQYALFSSLMTLPGKFLSGFSGIIADTFGYPWFFILVSIAGIPAVLLTLWYAMSRLSDKPVATPTSAGTGIGKPSKPAET